MIKPDELMLENLIYYNGEVMTIYSIDRGGHSFYRINDIAINKNTGCTINGGEDVFSYVKLTEDWLKRMGFKDYGLDDLGGWRCWRLGFITIKSGAGGFHFYFTHDGKLQLKPLFYVHEFQNLYFLLNGAELTIDGIGLFK